MENIAISTIVGTSSHMIRLIGFNIHDIEVSCYNYMFSLCCMMYPIKLINVNTVQTDRAKNVWARAYLIPERNRNGRRQEEVRILFIYLFFCMNLGEINALLTIFCCQMKHFGYVTVCHRILIEK